MSRKLFERADKAQVSVEKVLRNCGEIVDKPHKETEVKVFRIIDKGLRKC